MAKQWSRYRNDPERYCYRSGQTAEILWNVAESGCGSAPVTIRNTATASLYNYTPYQPNAAVAGRVPGPRGPVLVLRQPQLLLPVQQVLRVHGWGDRPGPSSAAGVALTVPDNRFVDPAIAGRTITAPTAAVAAGLAAGLSTLGLPYVWGGGGSGAGPDNGCARGAGLFNSCGSEIGFDCSGLTAFVLGRAGFVIPGNSTLQRRSGDRIGWDRAMPGDIVGFPGHVAIYLGTIGENRFILEASWVGTPVHVTRLTRGDADPVVLPLLGGDRGDAGIGRATYRFPQRLERTGPGRIRVRAVTHGPPARRRGPTVPADRPRHVHGHLHRRFRRRPDDALGRHPAERNDAHRGGRRDGDRRPDHIDGITDRVEHGHAPPADRDRAGDGDGDGVTDTDCDCGHDHDHDCDCDCDQRSRAADRRDQPAVDRRPVHRRLTVSVAVPVHNADPVHVDVAALVDGDPDRCSGARGHHRPADPGIHPLGRVVGA